MGKYTRQQWLTLIVFAIADFCSAVCVSLQAPFYPILAESKGATPTQYGFVFGIFELTVFIVSPIYGNYLNKIGPKFMFNAGIFTTATTCIMFGFLDRINDTNVFIGLSFAIRIVEAMGNSGFLTASFSIIAKEFPDNVGATFASLETCFGLGMIVGPTLGGALFELGGYTLPFVTLGCMLLCAASLTYCILPSYSSEFKGESGSSGSMISLIKVPAIALAAYAIIASSISIGFLQATLEPHLRPLKLSPFQLGLMFVLNGATYGFFAPLWGWLCDKRINPRIVVIFGSFMVMIAFIIIGPAPFLPIPTTLPLCIFALVLHGTGFGAELVATFTSAHRDAVVNGFPDDIETYGLVSGLWTSTFALGAFIGPSAAGALFDWIGFGWASVFVVALHLIVAISFILNMCCTKKKRNSGLYIKIHESLAKSDPEKASLITATKKNSFSSISDSSYFSGASDTSEEYYIY
ncbi:MFS-type transporter SLC18B1-like [Homarus americanus]|uniref:MFS-type transporter Slc18B1-like 2 n=1 Tax=Homarus americanus TaxID=6706 RepID=A0A8J5MTW2_HOMAM|nr:MFS-type transporter SLC18B1-like [Homarus americanus]KAG7163416.1 MFS-type transporter Slc18B1-like 2 [Homarus americanus]